MSATASLNPANQNVIVILIEHPLKSNPLGKTAIFGVPRAVVVNRLDCTVNLV
jgi:hypothetical protein